MSAALRRRRSRGQWIASVAEMADVRNLADALAFIAFWLCIGLIGWMVLDPYGFRDAVLRVLGVTP